MKRFLLLISIVFVVFTVTTIFSQDKVHFKQKMHIPLADNIPVTLNNYHNPAYNPQSQGSLFIYTGYDYQYNNSIGPMITMVPDLDANGTDDPVFTAMQRFSDINAQRKQMFGYHAFGIIDGFSAFDTTGAVSASDTYGWGTVQYCDGGPFNGNALLMAHSNGMGWYSRIDLVNLMPVLPFPNIPVGANFPSFVYTTSGDMIITDTDREIYISTDGGNSFNYLLSIGDGDPNVNWNSSSYYPAEWPVFQSDNSQYLTTVGAGGAGTGSVPDIVYLYRSTDGGASFSGMIAGYGSGAYPVYGQVINRDYAPYFDNFAQLKEVVSNNGVTHIVMNGYGEGIVPGGTEITSVFPVLYWNSAQQQWIAVTDPSTEGEGDGFGNYVIDPSGNRYYPGNGIGQAYPCVSTSPDGQIVFIAWQGYEYTGAVGSSSWNVFPGDGSSESGPIYYTDLYYVISSDGGVNWSSPSILKGDPGVMEQYPELDPRIIVNGDTAIVHYLYMDDAIPGIAIFNGQIAGQNSWSDNTKWLYDEFEFTTVPVELTDFSACLNENTVNLKWSTATETNNRGFEIQRKADKTKWITVGFVEGKGTTTEPQVYSFADKLNNIQGIISYRLKQVDFDGKFEYSKIVNISVNTIPAEFCLMQNYPNPFNPETVISYSIAKTDQVTLKVYDVLGSEVATLVNEVKEPGRYSVSFNGTKLSSGIYIYKITAGTFSSIKKMILTK